MKIHEFAALRHVKWEPDAKELREFAVTMLVGFLALGGLAAWRRHEVGSASLLLWTAGLLLAAGSCIPRLSRSLYLVVYVVSGLAGYVISQILLCVVFFALFAPIGAILRLRGKDPLRLSSPATSPGWSERREQASDDTYSRRF